MENMMKRKLLLWSSLEGLGLNTSYSPNSLKWGYIGVTKGDTGSLDYSSYTTEDQRSLQTESSSWAPKPEACFNPPTLALQLGLLLRNCN